MARKNMKNMLYYIMLISIISLIMFLYILVNYYIYGKLLAIIPNNRLWLLIYRITFIAVASSFLVGRIIERVNSGIVSGTIILVGSFWLGIAYYLFLFFLAADVIIFLLTFFHLVPGTRIAGTMLLRSWTFVALVTALTVFGHLNSKNIRVTTIRLDIPKQAGTLKTLNLVAVSDIHLGTLIRNSRLKHIIDTMNSLNPDIVLLPGDVVDEDLAPVIKYNMGDELKAIKSKFGVFASTGNHEYIGGVESAVHYLSQYGIKYLRDEKALVNNSFYLIGREDSSRFRFTGKKRKELQDIMTGIDKNYPLLLMDHQPRNLKDAYNNKIDFQISGHTHNGQLFPNSFITNMIFKKSWGYLRDGQTHYYVSCGVGTWGPPMRIGSIAEVTNIIINFKP
ncbi:MAG TPA: metallophosphoesterase [Candidatus Margulisbacteria bacterium]|nr:metallophosphoesterase [Candidatus Margulisiibacteriota bacterium]